MQDYTLNVASKNGGQRRSITFSAQNITAALERAREEAGKNEAELFLGAQRLARLRLVSDEGVWLIDGPRDQENDGSQGPAA